MDFLCKICDQSIIEDEYEYNRYLANLCKKNDKSLYTKYFIDKVNLDEFDKILSDYISLHNRKFNLYVFKLTFELEFNNNSIQSIDTNYCLNNDINVIRNCLLRCIEYFILSGYNLCNINHISSRSRS